MPAVNKLMCEGRVAIVTGAGRGLGREHALLLAAHGAKVVVNDIGAGVDGTGSDASPASEVVDLIRKAGGEAVADGHDVSDWKAAKAMIDGAIKTYGKLDVLINNAGILRDRMLTNMDEGEWDCAPERRVRPLPPRRRTLARPQQDDRRAGERAHHQHEFHVRHLR